MNFNKLKMLKKIKMLQSYKSIKSRLNKRKLLIELNLENK